MLRSISSTRSFATPCLAALAAASLGVATPARAACDVASVPLGNEIAELETALGTICIELLPDDAPLAVANFLYYLDNGLMVDTFFHRHVPGFVLQGGGFRVGATDYDVIPADNGPVVNEPCTLDILAPSPPAPPGTMICSQRGNERGTVALAKLSGDPDSGTTNWFINLSDNRVNLDNQNGGFTVFGRVQDMTAVDAIAALMLPNNDDVAWLESAIFTVATAPPYAPSLAAPMQQPPLYGTTYGCFDPGNQASVLNSSLQVVADPLIPFFPFTVSAGCGTPTTVATFTPDPGPPGCTDVDRIAVRTTGPAPPVNITGGSPTFAELTCDQTAEALTQRALWQADFIDHFNDQLVTLDVTVTTVPEPAPFFALPLGAGLLALLGRRRAR